MVTVQVSDHKLGSMGDAAKEKTAEGEMDYGFGDIDADFIGRRSLPPMTMCSMIVSRMVWRLQ